MSTPFNQSLFESMPVIGILRNFSLDTINKIIPYYLKAGFTTIEVTMNSKDAEQSIQKLTEDYPTLNVGAGTVCNSNDLEKALNAGASFIVTPIIDEEVINYCLNKNIPIFPGSFTPTEIYNSYQLGATAVKVFPATTLGPNYIKDVLGPLNELKLIPTGGVTVHTIEDFFNTGSYAVGMGGSLFKKDLITNHNLEELYLHFKEIAQRVSKYTK